MRGADQTQEWLGLLGFAIIVIAIWLFFGPHYGSRPPEASLSGTSSSLLQTHLGGAHEDHARGPYGQILQQ